MNRRMEGGPALGTGYLFRTRLKSLNLGLLMPRKYSGYVRYTYSLQWYELKFVPQDVTAINLSQGLDKILREIKLVEETQGKQLVSVAMVPSIPVALMNYSRRVLSMNKRHRNSPKHVANSYRRHFFHLPLRTPHTSSKESCHVTKVLGKRF